MIYLSKLLKINTIQVDKRTFRFSINNQLSVRTYDTAEQAEHMAIITLYQTLKIVIKQITDKFPELLEEQCLKQ